MGAVLFQCVALRNQIWFREIPETMSRILLGLEGVECNIDDVLVHGKDQQEQDERLETVLKRLL